MSNKGSHKPQVPKPNRPSNPSLPATTQPTGRNEPMSFDPRTISKTVYEALVEIRGNRPKDDPIVKKQKSMAQELYTYLSTWGLMRLKAEEKILKDGREEPVKEFFKCLKELSGKQGLEDDNGLNILKGLDVNDYLGLTGLGLAIAREFSFWTSAVYHDVKGEN